MFKIKERLLLVAISAMLLVGGSGVTYGATAKKADSKNNKLQRTASQVFDQQDNTVSNLEFAMINNGIFGLNQALGVGGGFWPRGTMNQYIFGGGIWLAAQKKYIGDSTNADGEKVLDGNGDPIRIEKYRKMVEVSYNPNSGQSWMVPGRIEDGDKIDETDVTKYRSYFSTDFKNQDGQPIDPNDGPAWPIWVANEDVGDTLKLNRYFGTYIVDEDDRRVAVHERGPAFISGEDIFCTYKDTDLNFFEGGFYFRKNLGYPYRMQFEQMIYSWGYGLYKDFIFIKYDMINMSEDTLLNCYLAPVMDIDIALKTNSSSGAANDRCRFYEEDEELNLAFQWSMGDRGEKGRGFGYLGFDFLESPSSFRCEETIRDTVDGKEIFLCKMCVEHELEWNAETEEFEEICTEYLIKPESEIGFMRNDRRKYENRYQTGLTTFRNWPISEDKKEDNERYEFMASNQRDGDDEDGDKRFMMSTGPFNIRPADTARVVVGIMLAKPSVRVDPDGTEEDVQNLVKINKFAQEVYDNNFRAPKPPDAPIFGLYKPLTNGVIITWDSSAEMSVDKLEDGLDFMGYKLYRARRTDLDTFDIEQTDRKGPFGWKQVRSWTLPTPYRKSYLRAGPNQDDFSYPRIDSMRIVGPAFDKNGDVEPFAIRVIKVPTGVNLLGDDTRQMEYYKFFGKGAYNIAPVVINIDTNAYSRPWGPFFHYILRENERPGFYNHTAVSGNKSWVIKGQSSDPHNYVIDSVMLATVYLDRALLDFNPYFYERITVSVDMDSVDLYNQEVGFVELEITDNGDGTYDTTEVVHDYKYLRPTLREQTLDGVTTWVMDKLVAKGKGSNPYINMTDTTHIQACLDSVYHYIQAGFVKSIDRYAFEESQTVRENVIEPYMSLITNNRTFMDLGDDNFSGELDKNLDPGKTEVMINNIDYFYKLEPFDEGDFLQPSNLKPNKANAVAAPHMIAAVPKAPPVGRKTDFEVTYVDSANIGGLYDFEFFAINDERARQLFSGHELELEFNPRWSWNEIIIRDNETNTEKTHGVGTYWRRMTLTDLTTGDVLYDGNTWFEQNPCQFSYLNGFTENAVSYIWADDKKSVIDTISGEEITFALTDDNGVRTRSGKFSTGDFNQYGYCYTNSMMTPGRGNLGFKFNYTMQQYGGLVRANEGFVLKGDNVSTRVGKLDAPAALITEKDVFSYGNLYYLDSAMSASSVSGGGLPQYQSLTYGNYQTYQGYNNGPGEYLVEFLPGGEETLTVQYGDGPTEKTITVKYLKTKITNVISYDRPAKDGSSVPVTYQGEYDYVKIPYIDNEIPSQGTYLPKITTLEKDDALITQYNISTYGFINPEADMSSGDRKDKMLRSVDPMLKDLKVTTPQCLHQANEGRYYLTATDGSDEFAFTHVVIVGGAQFYLDYPNVDGRTIYGTEWKWDENVVKANDLKAGDQVVLKTGGGPLGMPMPGTKVRVKIKSGEVALADYKDDDLDNIMVVPNPYYVTHQGEQSPYDTKLYFTRLPELCTIEIYTVAGNHVRTLDHNASNSSEVDKLGVDVWDLLSRNRQRVGSQTLVAIIKTPNGAQTIKKFSVIVGGFRVIED